ALACQLGDPCWEGVAARGIGVATASSSPEDAIAVLDDARLRCMRFPDTYQWVYGYVLDALCDVAVGAGHPSARGHVDTLGSLAAKTSMREFVVRAHRHRARLGDGDAAETARLLAADIDNPALDRLLSR